MILIKLYMFLKVRAGVEMALIDAVTNSIGVPLWRLFGGVSNTLTTAITVKFLNDHYYFSYDFCNEFLTCVDEFHATSFQLFSLLKLLTWLQSIAN